MPSQGPVARSDDRHAKQMGMNSPLPCKLVVQAIARRKARGLATAVRPVFRFRSQWERYHSLDFPRLRPS